MFFKTEDAIKQADRIVHMFGTRNPSRIANELNIIIMPRNFKKQKGVYKVIERNRFIFIKDDLPPVMNSIVLLHEIGHDVLHRNEAISTGGFQEFNIFDMTNKRMEYEANMFAAQVALSDEEIIEYIHSGYDIEQIAGIMDSDINLVALKVAELNRRGYHFREQQFKSTFLQ